MKDFFSGVVAVIGAVVDKAVLWLVVSSADPGRASLTVKGILLGSVTYIMIAANLAHVDLGDGSALTAVFDAAATLLQTLLSAVAAMMTLYGAIRKFWYLLSPKRS